MKKNLLKNLPAIILFSLALLTRFIFLGYPAEVVFDEVHFGKFVSAYFTGQYYFDIHPPLGKMMLAGFFKIFNNSSISNPNKTFSTIGENLDKNILFSLRFLPALFGALFVVLVYFLILSFGLSRKSAFLGGFLALADNSLLVESKFILVDIFLLFFGGLSLLLYFLYRKKPKFFLLILSALFAGLAFGIKWTGVSFYFLILIVFCLDSLKNFKIKSFILKTIVLIFVPLIVYFSVFVIHFQLLQKPGDGDAFMSKNFQSKNLVSKFIELNQVMLRANASITTQHPFSSKWYQWPANDKPIWYWTKTDNVSGKIGNIYLIGNPLVFFPVLAAVIFSFIAIFQKKFRKKITLLLGFLILGYFSNLLPYLLITRPTFLYHYLPSLFFGIIILSYLWDKINSREDKKEIKPYKIKLGKITPEIKKEFLGFASKFHFFIYFFYLLLVALSFLALSPLTYGFLISPKTMEIYNTLMKFLSWKI